MFQYDFSYDFLNIYVSWYLSTKTLFYGFQQDEFISCRVLLLKLSSSEGPVIGGLSEI